VPPATGGGAGKVVIKSTDVIMEFTIAVTMYRSTSGGLDLQELDVSATAAVVFYLLDQKFGIISFFILFFPFVLFSLLSLSTQQLA